MCVGYLFVIWESEFHIIIIIICVFLKCLDAKYQHRRCWCCQQDEITTRKSRPTFPLILTQAMIFDVFGGFNCRKGFINGSSTVEVETLKENHAVPIVCHLYNSLLHKTVFRRRIAVLRRSLNGRELM